MCKDNKSSGILLFQLHTPFFWSRALWNKVLVETYASYVPHTLAVRIALLSFKNVVKIPVGHHLLCCFLRLILLLGGFFSDLGKKKFFLLFLWLVWCAAGLVHQTFSTLACVPKSHFWALNCVYRILKSLTICLLRKHFSGLSCPKPIKLWKVFINKSF